MEQGERKAKFTKKVKNRLKKNRNGKEKRERKET
jgi:hypothetical protein